MPVVHTESESNLDPSQKGQPEARDLHSAVVVDYCRRFRLRILQSLTYQSHCRTSVATTAARGGHPAAVGCVPAAFVLVFDVRFAS